ncbi:hypothetical protein GCM10010862_15980 [Devosia nitrariae]|uniref:BrnT family toxin n=1 Tax=Devosia nitrariae TaxID=2071872 RepID=A0ABQ5W2P8_9HYPH|nr:hypothetical protein GCM10010862_15980 [Devosia nitrariae]
MSFEVAYLFDWTGAGVLVDDRRACGEERLVAYGEAGDGDGYVIVFTIRAGIYRIISIRRFGRRDYLTYEQLKRQK